jgi:hypothetical protein
MTRIEELQNLQKLLKNADPITHPVLSDWVSGSDDRRALLSGSVWGGIRWPKGLGRPTTPSITGGFSIVHMFKESDIVDVGGGHYVERGKFLPMPVPYVWDASTASEHRVAFFFYARGGFFDSNKLIVTFASVSWQFGLLFSPGFLRLDPYGFGEFTNNGGRMIFPDFLVKLEPYRRIRSVQPLGPMKTADTHAQFDAHRETAVSGAD